MGANQIVIGKWDFRQDRDAESQHVGRVVVKYDESDLPAILTAAGEQWKGRITGRMRTMGQAKLDAFVKRLKSGEIKWSEISIRSDSSAEVAATATTAATLKAIDGMICMEVTADNIVKWLQTAHNMDEKTAEWYLAKVVEMRERVSDNE